MNKNIKIAKELVKLAKNLMAMYGDDLIWPNNSGSRKHGPTTTMSIPSQLGYCHFCWINAEQPPHEAFDCKYDCIQSAYNKFLHAYGKQYQQLKDEQGEENFKVVGTFFEIDKNIYDKHIIQQAEQTIDVSYAICKTNAVYRMITPMYEERGIYFWVFVIDKKDLLNISKITKGLDRNIVQIQEEKFNLPWIII